MDSDNDSSNSNDGPIHRRRTQGTRPPPSHHSHDRVYHSTKEEEEIYSNDEEEHFQENSYDDIDQHQTFPRYSGPLRDQDRFLPIANIAKIMKKGIPEKGKIAKDAKETIQECVSEFVSFVTSEASDRCLQEKRKTINGEDILLAMLSLGFDSYIEPLKTFLTKIRDASKYDRTITMGGDLSDDIPKQTTTTTTTATNSSELEPYGNSVRVVTCLRNDQNEENGNYVYTIQPYQ